MKKITFTFYVLVMAASAYGAVLAFVNGEPATGLWATAAGIWCIVSFSQWYQGQKKI